MESSGDSSKLPRVSIINHRPLIKATKNEKMKNRNGLGLHHRPALATPKILYVS